MTCSHCRGKGTVEGALSMLYPCPHCTLSTVCDERQPVKGKVAPHPDSPVGKAMLKRSKELDIKHAQE